MATLNPLEQKARSSFIKGFIIALILGLLAAGGIGFLYVQKLNEESQRIKAQKSVLVLNADVSSGQEVNSSMLKSVNVDGNVAPTNGAATSFSQMLGYFSGNSDGDIDESKVTLVAKTNLYKNTIVTKDMLDLSTEKTSDDLRLEQYNMIVLPVDLKSEDTVDIRLRLPSGQDYVVISKKNVTIPDVGGSPSPDTIQMKVSEDEILTMSAAIVDAYKTKGSKLYAVKYAEPGLQGKVTATYVPDKPILELIASDSNIVNEAKSSLITFYNANFTANRTPLQVEMNKDDAETQKSNVESGTSSEASTQKSQRQQYLQGME